MYSPQGSRELVKEPQALLSQEGHVLHGAGIAWWYEALLWLPGFPVGLSCHPLWAVSCKPTRTAVGWNSAPQVTPLLEFRWGTTHSSVPLGWNSHPKGNNHMPCLLVYKEFVRPAGVLLKQNCIEHSWKLEGSIQTWPNWFERVQTGWKKKGHLEMSTRLDTSWEIQICMCKNIYWACFAVACLCNFCQIVSQECHWNSRSCFSFNTFDLGSNLFQKYSFLPHWNT